MNRPRRDFAEIKSRVSFEQVMQLLDLELKRSGAQFRGTCPVHGGTQRTLAVTPGDGFYCWATKQGGDQIALYAHVRECNNYEAATALSEHFRIEVKPNTARVKPHPPQVKPESGLEPLKDLDPTHEALELYGLSQAVCDALGAGYCNKGMMVGRIAIPLRLPDGTLIGYMGFATKADQKPLIKIPANLDERCGTPDTDEEQPEVKSQDEMRRLLRVV